MKQISSILVTIVFSVLTQSAFAAKPTVVVSQLTSVAADPELGANPDGGQVVYDSVRDTLSLTIYFYGSRCIGSNICTASKQPPLRAELPVVSFTEGHCGAKVIAAEENLMPVDGVMQRITVSDNTINYCLVQDPIAAVTGDYTAEFLSRDTAELVTWKATFEGLPFTNYVK